MSSVGCAEEAAERVAVEVATRSEFYLERHNLECFADWAETVFIGLSRIAPRAWPALTVFKSLGDILSRPSQNGQARTLLNLLQRYPLEARDGAGVSFTWRDEHRLVAVGLEADCVLRLTLHGDPPCSGLVEVWPGYALHRLNAAANGGSFAQIPGGRSSAIEIDVP